MWIYKFLTKSFIGLSFFSAISLFLIINNVELKTIKDCIWFVVPVVANGILIFYGQFEKSKHAAYFTIWALCPLVVAWFSFNVIAAWAIIILSLIFSSLVALVLKADYQMKKIELKH
jgi:hypothetical protein